MDIINAIESTRFLGAEFLSWLWFRAEATGGNLDLEGHGEIEVIFEDRLVLETVAGDRERHVLSGLAPGLTREAGVALEMGKSAVEAKARIIKDSRAWSFSLVAQDLALKSIRIPKVLSSEDDDRFQERLYLMEELESIIESLYQGFLELRLSDGWASQLEEIRGWVEEKVQ